MDAPMNKHSPYPPPPGSLFHRVITVPVPARRAQLPSRAWCSCCVPAFHSCFHCPHNCNGDAQRSTRTIGFQVRRILLHCDSSEYPILCRKLFCYSSLADQIVSRLLAWICPLCHVPTFSPGFLVVFSHAGDSLWGLNASCVVGLVVGDHGHCSICR